MLSMITQLLVFTVMVPAVLGHGRLRDPPSRASMWRDGFPENPTNYQDNELFCGGFAHQQELDGKCGICGDPWDGVREHEAGGTYANGIITRHYQQGQNMLILVEITAHHKGYFEFRLCPNDDPTKVATQECLDTNLLVLEDPFPGETRYDTPENTPDGFHHITVRLPDDVTCTQCVLQWKYNCGNNWGTDPDTGESCLGCGPQEQFYGCSDLSITPPGEPIPENRPRPAKATIASEETTVEKTTLDCQSVGDWAGNADLKNWCDDNCNNNNCPETHCKCVPKHEKVKIQVKGEELDEVEDTIDDHQITDDSKCHAIGAYRHRPRMNKWCRRNCKVGNCPITHCECGSTNQNSNHKANCTAIGPWKNVKGMSQWCNSNCVKKDSKTCPSSRCLCV